MAALFFLEIFAYYASGLFLLENVTTSNYSEKLTYIFIHFYRFWWNDRTPGIMGLVLILWALGVSYFLTYYKDYHFDAEHGVAEWEDVEKAQKRLMDPNDPLPTYLSQNITISSNSLSNMNILVIGGSGSYKTTSVLTPNLLAANCTNVFLDIKGELLKKHGNYLKAHGITVKSLNLKSPLESDRYNPFLYIHNFTDLIGLITNLQESVTPPDAQKGDPFWQDGVGLYLQSMFEYEWLQAKEEDRTGSMNNILKLVNMESKKIDENGTT